MGKAPRQLILISHRPGLNTCPIGLRLSWCCAWVSHIYLCSPEAELKQRGYQRHARLHMQQAAGAAEDSTQAMPRAGCASPMGNTLTPTAAAYFCPLTHWQQPHQCLEAARAQ